MNYLVDMIEDFPRDWVGGSDADIEKAREWVTAQGGAANLKIKD